MCIRDRCRPTQPTPWHCGRGSSPPSPPIATMFAKMFPRPFLWEQPVYWAVRRVPWLLLVAAIFFALSGPVSRWLERRKSRVAAPAEPKRLPLFFAALVVSFYVGYFGAGAGFLFMTMLALFGYQDIHAINALKVVANTLANGVAFIIFVVDKQVVWRYCLLAMIVCAIGGYTSASLARKIPQPVLRSLVVVIGLS